RAGLPTPEKNERAIWPREKPEKERAESVAAGSAPRRCVDELDPEPFVYWVLDESPPVRAQARYRHLIPVHDWRGVHPVYGPAARPGVDKPKSGIAFVAACIIRDAHHEAGYTRADDPEPQETWRPFPTSARPAVTPGTENACRKLSPITRDWIDYSWNAALALDFMPPEHFRQKNRDRGGIKYDCVTHATLLSARELGGYGRVSAVVLVTPRRPRLRGFVEPTLDEWLATPCEPIRWKPGRRVK